MPLTPTDVANKQFRIAFRGYSLDEVDAFLDEVESELSRLLRDNAELRSRPAGAAPAPAAAPAAAPAPAPAPPAPISGMEGQEAALRTLLLAQRTADEAIAEARAEADQLLGSARVEADRTLNEARGEAARTLSEARSEADHTLGSARAEAEQSVGSARAEAEQTLNAARAEAERTLGTARAQADQMVAAARAEAEKTLTAARVEAGQTLTAARTEAETTLTTSREKAARVDEEVAARISAALGDLDTRRRTLEAKIEELTAFEREYRTRLKAYLEGQLRDLDSRSGPDDGGAGVPAGARAAAVRGRAGEAPAGPPTPRGAAPAGDGEQVGPFTVVPSGTPDSDDRTPPAGR